MAVDTLHREYAAALSQWEKCRAASAGQEAVHAAGAAYLPKLTGQSHDEYEAFKGRTLYYNATGRTVDGLSGLIFRRPPTVEVPEAMDYLQADIDTAGTPLLAFAEHVVEELLQTGRIGMLVDYPPLEGVRTLADEQAAGGRPFVRTYAAESIINWRVERIGNRNTLTLVVLKECREEVSADGFDASEVDVWRELKLTDGTYTVRTFEKAKDTTKNEFIETSSYTPTIGQKPLSFMPFLICGTMGISEKVGKPPILDLANVNLSHYRTTADYEHGLHFTGLPTPVVYGHSFDKGEVFALGSSVVKAFANSDAKAEFLEFQGKGLDQLSKRLDEKEGMMAALGARMLANEKRQVEAAETAAIHRSGENSVLSSLANAASSALTRALEWCAMWAGVAAEPKVELNTDYLPTGMTAQELTALVGAWQAGGISHLTLLDNLGRGELTRQGVTPEEEIAAIEEEGPKLGLVGDPLTDPTDPNGQRQPAAA
jgi:hypothetical protein